MIQVHIAGRRTGILKAERARPQGSDDRISNIGIFHLEHTVAEKKQHGCWNQMVKGSKPLVLLTSSVTLDQEFHLLETQGFHL